MSDPRDLPPPPTIQPWTKVGEPSILSEGFGKKFVSQWYRNPVTNEDVEFTLFGQRDWSVVLPLTAANRIVAVREYKQGCDGIVLELPAGTADSDAEDPMDVVRRELLEETGYSADSVVSLGKPLYMSTRNSWTRFHTFLATGCREAVEPVHDPREVVEIQLCTVARWVQLCSDEVVEPSAVVTTFRALPHLGVSLLDLAPPTWR